MTRRRDVHPSIILASSLLAGLWVSTVVGQDLRTTCPLVKAAVCLGYCSATPPSTIRSGYCSTRRRKLLSHPQAASTPAAAHASGTTSSSSSPPAVAAHAGPRPDWRLQPAPAAPQDAAAAGTEAQVPQRVLPYGINSTDPPETPEQQQQIVQRLEDILSQPDNSSSTAAAGDTQVWQPPGRGGQAGGDSSSDADADAADDAVDSGTDSDSSSTDSDSSTSEPAGGDPAPGSPPPTVPAQPQHRDSPREQQPVEQQQQQQSQSPQHQHLSFSFSWLPLWFPHIHQGRQLQQDSQDPQQQQGQQEAPTAVPLSGAPTPTDASTAAANSLSTAMQPPAQCPAGSVLSSSEGTCVSTPDAFTGSSSAEPLEISTVSMEVPAGQQAEPAPAARQMPLDPGTQPTVVLGPDGVAVGSAGEVQGGGMDTGSSSGSGSGGNADASSSSAGGGGVTRAVAAYSGPVSQVSRTLTMIGNSKIKVGVDLERAGAVSWVSSPLMPAPWTNQNLINTWDQGRLLQQSFYGCVDGSCWANRPWLWNPVQGGSWQNAPGLTTKQVVKAGRYVYAEGHGRNWGRQDLVRDVTFTTNVTLLDNVAVVKYTMLYAGSVTHNYMTQETPAVFVDRRFSVLAYYDGAAPWTNDKAIKYAFPPGRNIYARPTESWAAYIDPTTGWGLGVYNPMAWLGITAYRIGPDGADSRPWDCSYFAHTIRMQLHPGMKPYPYTIYITVGRLDAIRATFYRLRTQPSVLAAQASTLAATRAFTPSTGGPTAAPGASPPAEPVGPQRGQPDLGRNTWYGQQLNLSMFDNVVLPGQDGQAVGQGSGSEGRAGPGTDPARDGGAGDRGLEGQQGRALTRGQFAGVVVGAVAGCALMAAVVVVRAVQQRRAAAAAAADSRAELLSTPVSYSPSRSPSKAGPNGSRSRAHSGVSSPYSYPAHGSPGAAAAASGSSGGSPDRPASRRPSGVANASGGVAQPVPQAEASPMGDGTVSVSAVTPEVGYTPPVTRSAAKLGKEASERSQ